MTFQDAKSKLQRPEPATGKAEVKAGSSARAHSDPHGERLAHQVGADIDPESVALNLRASIRVYSHHHFFSWTQGLLQNVIPHEVLICALRNGEGEALDVEGFSTNPAEHDIFAPLYREDAALSAKLVTRWIELRYKPFAFDVGGDVLPDDSALGAELKRIGASRVLFHGTHDSRGRMARHFIFACRPEDAGERHMPILEMLVPSLDAAWLRTRINVSTAQVRDKERNQGRDILTAREQEVLRWVYVGKSNMEIGMILGISPLTVKNHVQEILRRLDVQNRAQAVGKAFKLRILSC